MLVDAIGLATEDGASNNVTANRILGQEMKVCLPHNVARCVLYSVGEAGKPSQNVPLKNFIARASKQSAAFNRSVVANVSLQQAQLDEDPDLKPHQTLTTKTKNITRWLGLWDMANRNRRIGPEIRIALTGDKNGNCLEAPAPNAARPMREGNSTSDESDASSDSDGEDQEEGNRAANKKYPLAHRCLSLPDFGSNEILESVLDRPREVTLLSQDGDGTQGATGGLDLGEGFVLLQEMRAEATADRVEIISGRRDEETWTETNAASLPAMFQTQRKIFAEQLTTRFHLDSTPDRHTLLALKMHPAINTAPDGPQLAGKQAKGEIMDGEYKRALRRQALLRLRPAVTSPPVNPATTIPVAATATATATGMPAAPAVKKRKGLMGCAVSAQRPAPATEAQSPVDIAVKAEIEQFDITSKRILDNGLDDPYYGGTERFNLTSFWADHKAALPFHYGVYVAEVGCKMLAAANVETVFSGAGKYTEEAKSAGPQTLQRKVKLHYGWRYEFIRPSVKEVVKRYNEKWPRSKAGPTAAAVANGAKMAAAAVAAATAVDATTGTATAADTTTGTADVATPVATNEPTATSPTATFAEDGTQIDENGFPI